MFARTECISCIFNQIYRIAKEAGVSDENIRLILSIAGSEINNFNFLQTPPELAYPLYSLVIKISQNKDPYADIKREHIKKAKKLIKRFLKREHEDMLLDYVKLSIIGNAIDLGSTVESIDIKDEMLDISESKFHLEKLEDFRKEIRKAKRVCFISDNAGETVFDKPLVDLLMKYGKEVVYAVKSYPIINDATYKDAVTSGINCEISKTGSPISGTILRTCSDEFLKLLGTSDIIIAKGQANFETLSQEELPIFFLLKVKCLPISKETGFEIGSLLLLKSSYLRII